MEGIAMGNQEDEPDLLPILSGLDGLFLGVKNASVPFIFPFPFRILFLSLLGRLARLFLGGLEFDVDVGYITTSARPPPLPFLRLSLFRV
jgi:hypothetical protein